MRMYQNWDKSQANGSWRKPTLYIYANTLRNQLLLKKQKKKQNANFVNIRCQTNLINSKRIHSIPATIANPKHISAKNAMIKGKR